jgi:hypothetical protein
MWAARSQTPLHLEADSRPTLARPRLSSVAYPTIYPTSTRDQGCSGAPPLFIGPGCLRSLWAETAGQRHDSPVPCDVLRIWCLRAPARSRVASLSAGHEEDGADGQ